MIPFFKMQQFGHRFEFCIFMSSGTTELLDNNNYFSRAPEMLAYNSAKPAICSRLNRSYRVFLLKKKECFILSQAVLNAEATVGQGGGKKNCESNKNVK